MNIIGDSQVIKVKYMKNNYLHGHLKYKEGFTYIMFAKGKVLSWIFKNEKYMWMMGIDWREQEFFSGDRNVLYLDCWLQGCLHMSKLIELYTYCMCIYYMQILPQKKKKCVLSNNYVNL